jgi:hypothetical protein
VTIITTTCRRCGTEFEPGREAIVAGAWRVCPDCREGDDTLRGPALPTCAEVWETPRSLPRPEAATMRLSRLQHMIGRSVECLGDA